jgi:nucleotide-binding universal stress UspA family protein
MLRIQTILVPTDFSDTSADVVEVAQSLARDHAARLVLMTSPPSLPPMSEANIPLSEMSEMTEDSRSKLNALAKTIPQIPVETRVVIGFPGPSIVAAAADCQADLIVMGTHGRSGLGRMLMGSVAEHVLRHAPCPVLTIKPATTGHLSQVEETSLTKSKPG